MKAVSKTNFGTAFILCAPLFPLNTFKFTLIPFSQQKKQFSNVAIYNVLPQQKKIVTLHDIFTLYQLDNRQPKIKKLKIKQPCQPHF